jgi:hypothetical protein
MANDIEKVEPPALPFAGEDYNRPYFDQFSNVLRLFFNRLTNTVNQLLSTEQGGKALYLPNALFYSTVDQNAAATNTGYAVAFENTYLANGIEINGGSSTQVTVSADGVYNFQITLQTAHTNSSAVQIWTWISKNGTPVTYGGQQQTIVGNANQPVFWNFSIDLTAGQYIEMYWATADLSLSLDSTAPTSPHPGIPSAIVAVSFVSNY